jgi:hypothetical protein
VHAHVKRGRRQVNGDGTACLESSGQTSHRDLGFGHVDSDHGPFDPQAPVQVVDVAVDRPRRLEAHHRMADANVAEVETKLRPRRRVWVRWGA